MRRDLELELTYVMKQDVGRHLGTLLHKRRLVFFGFHIYGDPVSSKEWSPLVWPTLKKRKQ